jgi:hypothetical protein
MADISIAGTDQLGQSVPGFNVRPSNDYDEISVLMDVDVVAGQLVYMKTNKHGALATATLGAMGISTETKKAGYKVALLTRGKMAGFTVATNPGTPVYTSATAGAVADGTSSGADIIGTYVGDGQIYFNFPPQGGWS